jgi:hypothetical protein
LTLDALAKSFSCALGGRHTAAFSPSLWQSTEIVMLNRIKNCR